MRGSLSDSSQPLYRVTASLSAPGMGTVLGRQEKIAFPYAALANGTAAHSLELDDTHQGGSIHLGVSIFSAALAVAEQTGTSGKEFIAAVVAGFEAAARLAMAVKPKEHYNRGFHPTATCGTFGAAVSAAKLLGLDESQLLSALGIAGSQAAGSMEFLTDGARGRSGSIRAGRHSAAFMRHCWRGKGSSDRRPLWRGKTAFLRRTLSTPIPDASLTV